MARPLRIEYEGALHHVTSRGNRQEAIFEDDKDRQKFLEILGDVVKQMQWVCCGYCLMGNHYHLMIQTPFANLSKGMRQLNGTYTQASNRRHRRVGHLFQGRYKSIVVDSDAYLAELVRYVVLNPVRAGMVAEPGAWPWSSLNAMVGNTPAPSWLTVDAVLDHFAGNREAARRRFAAYVLEGMGNKDIWQHLQHQIYLGDDVFIARAQAQAGVQAFDPNVPGVQQRPPVAPLEEIAQRYSNRDEAVVVAYSTGEYSYAQIADHFGLHFTTVGRIVRKHR